MKKISSRIDKERQKADLQMLKYATALVKAGGILSLIHVSKTKSAHERFTKSVANVQAKMKEQPL